KRELPPLDKERGQSGWRLAATEKLSGTGDAKERLTDARKLLAKLIREHQGTPWEGLARREQFTAVGLPWGPTRFGQGAGPGPSRLRPGLKIHEPRNRPRPAGVGSSESPGGRASACAGPPSNPVTRHPMKRLVAGAVVLALAAFIGTARADDPPQDKPKDQAKANPTGTRRGSTSLGGQTRETPLKLKLEGGQPAGL